MKLFKKKDAEIEIDEIDVVLLTDSFQSQIENLIRIKNEELARIDNEIRLFSEEMNKKKQQINEQYNIKANKYQQLMLKINTEVTKNEN